MSILQIDGRTWRTPLTGIAADGPVHVGTARLIQKNQRGVFVHEGIDGYEFYQARHWLPVTILQQKHGRRWEIWMVDDPLHWHAMRAAVRKLPDGRIAVAGLGMGLMLHHMVGMDRFTHVDVFELNPDVIDLIRPTLPPNPVVRIHCLDFYRGIEVADPYDGILWDLAVGGPMETLTDFLRGKVLSAIHQPHARLVQFGLRDTPRPDVLETRD